MYPRTKSTNSLLARAIRPNPFGSGNAIVPICEAARSEILARHASSSTHSSGFVLSFAVAGTKASSTARTTSSLVMFLFAKSPHVAHIEAHKLSDAQNSAFSTMCTTDGARVTESSHDATIGSSRLRVVLKNHGSMLWSRSGCIRKPRTHPIAAHEISSSVSSARTIFDTFPWLRFEMAMATARECAGVVPIAPRATRSGYSPNSPESTRVAERSTDSTFLHHATDSKSKSSVLMYPLLIRPLRRWESVFCGEGQLERFPMG